MLSPHWNQMNRCARRVLAFAVLLTLPALPCRATAQRSAVGGSASGPGVAGTVPVAGPDAGAEPLRLDFEEFQNGQPLLGPEFGTIARVSSSGSNAGPAIFDSTSTGPNAGSADPDLLVDRGNVLILQNDLNAGQSSGGTFFSPDDDADGGTLRFDFFGAVEPRSIELVDVCPDGGSLVVTLTDWNGARRIFAVPAGFTNDISVQGTPGSLPLDLQTLEVQIGVSANATASEDPGFEPGSVVAVEVFLEGSGAVDDLVVMAGELDLPQRHYSVVSPSDMVATDVDGDGRMDAVVLAQTTITQIEVFRNRGDGVLSAATVHPLTGYATSISAGDLDLDGLPDLFVGGADPEELLVLPNLGDGTFGPGASLPVVERIESFLVLDLNGDGWPDLVGGPDNQTSSIGSVYLNDGSGGLGAPLPLDPQAGGNFGAIASGDLNGDGVPDLLLPLGVLDLALFLGNGDGTFAPVVEVAATCSITRSAATADLDGDGDEDVLLACSSGTLQLMENDGLGGLTPVATYPTLGSTDRLLLRDEDGDGDLDVFVAGTGGTVRLINEGGGLFGPPEDLGTGITEDLSFADVDGDGDLDLLARDFSGVVVTERRSDDSFFTRTVTSFDDADASVAADLNGDGVLDLANVDSPLGQISVLAGSGKGTFDLLSTFVSDGTPDTIVAGDLDGDGDQDLVVTCGSLDTVSLHENDGTGGFGPPTTFALGAGPSQAVLSDLDGDGDTDVVVSGSGGVGLGGGEVAIFLNDGTGTFTPEPPLFLGRAGYLVAADLDGDGDADLAVTQLFDDTYSVLFNRGDATFDPPVPYASALETPIDVVVGDWNGDGALDLVIDNVSGSTLDNDLMIELNDGSGGFTHAGTIAAQSSLGVLATADVDGDGVLDVLMGSLNEGIIAVARCRGDGTFEPRQEFSSSFSVRGVHVLDYNGDGLRDLVTVSSSGDVGLLSSSDE